MGKDTSPCVVGEYWLDKRRDGRSPKIWQIARYDPAARSDVYRSTKCEALDDAVDAIHAFVQKKRAKGPQQVDEAMVIPQLILFYDEHGQHARKPGTIASSLRTFIGFLMQDEVGAGMRISQITPNVITRFVAWRLGPHSYSVPWRGKDYDHKSEGVRGESVQRNIEDLRAALNHAVSNGRIPYVPKIPSVPDDKRSPPRDVVLSIEEMGAILGFMSMEKPIWRWVVLMMATGSRPDACLAFNPANQWRGAIIDMHPAGWPRTKKRNPQIPAIPALVPVLKDWKSDPHRIVRSRRTAWRMMRNALGLPEHIVPKTIRHSVATQLRTRGVPQEQISELLGHAYGHRTTGVYAKYDPEYLRVAMEKLADLFSEVSAAADRWIADHMRTKEGNGPVVVEKRNRPKGT